eukprot:8885872-Pyramimonas_sp.AAC.1
MRRISSGDSRCSAPLHQTDRQTVRQSDRQTAFGRQPLQCPPASRQKTVIQSYSHTDSQTDGPWETAAAVPHCIRQTDRQTDIQADSQSDRQTVGQTAPKLKRTVLVTWAIKSSHLT